MSEQDKALSRSLRQDGPNLKRRILRHSDSEPDAMNLEIVLLASIASIREKLERLVSLG